LRSPWNAVKREKLAGPERDAALEQVTITAELGDLADRDPVIGHRGGH
jgi:hypothetical protein